jgi:hypothetical protein
MELPHPPSAGFDTSTNLPFSKRLFDEKPVRAFRLTLPAKQSFKVDGVKYPIVVIGLTGPDATGVVNGKSFTKKGDYLFIPAGSPGFGISNEKGARDVQFAVFVLK